MTTMQKLAAFRYQPSSTGSVHKAVALMAAAQSEDASTHIGARTPSATLSSAELEAHTSGNESYQRGNHFKSSASTKAAGYGSDANHFSQAFLDSYPQADIHEPRLDMLMPQMGSTNISEHNGLPLTGPDHTQTEPVALEAPTFEILHTTKPSIAGTESRILPHTSLDLSDECRTMGRSGSKLDEWNSEYDGGLISDDFRSVEPDHGQQQEYMSLPLDMEAQTANLPGQEVSNVIEMEQYSHQTTNSADDDMLDYGVFDDLTAKPWSHMDYVVTTDGQTITRTDHAIQTKHERVGNVDEGREYVPGDSMMFEFNPETSLGHFVGDPNPVHSHDQIPNSELPPSTKGFADTHVQNRGPEQDVEDYFAALGDLDDHDFENVEILSSGNRHDINTTESRDVFPKLVPEPADEDYLAEFGDFMDEDFTDIEISAGHTGKEEPLRDQKISTNPSHVVQVPGTQLHAQPLKKNGLNSILQKLASRASPLQQASRDDINKDEYPLDEDEQAELNELRTSRCQAVRETREPPSSILRSEEDMRDMEMYDKTLKYSPVATSWVPEDPERNNGSYRELHEPLTDPEDWEFLRRPKDPLQSNTAPSLAMYTSVTANNREHSSEIPNEAENDDCSPLHPFARPPFPTANVATRSPVTGLSSKMLLRTCFRIGEALSQASLCSRDNQDAFTELFARVTFSSREADGKKQNFQFGDIFHNKPPFISGVLEKYASSYLQEAESFELITVDKEKRENELGQMVRVLGRIKRVIQGRGYSMDIVNIRKTDWEEVRWTQRILSPSWLGGCPVNKPRRKLTSSSRTSGH